MTAGNLQFPTCGPTHLRRRQLHPAVSIPDVDGDAERHPHDQRRPGLAGRLSINASNTRAESAGTRGLGSEERHDAQSSGSGGAIAIRPDYPETPMELSRNTGSNASSTAVP